MIFEMARFLRDNFFPKYTIVLELILVIRNDIVRPKN